MEQRELCKAGIRSSIYASRLSCARARWLRLTGQYLAVSVPLHSPALQIRFATSRMPTKNGCWPMPPPGL